MTMNKGKGALKNGYLKPLQPRDYICIGIITAFALVLYARCLNGHLLFDDRLALNLNQDSYANSTSSVWDLLQHDYWGVDLSSATPNRFFRPLTVFTFRAQNWFTAFHHSAFALRAVNLILSALNGVWVYVFARLILSVAGNDSDSLLSFGPAVAMLLFMVHPIHTEAVVFAVGRSTLLSTFFGFSALYCVHRILIALAPSFDKQNKSRNNTAGVRTKPARWYRLHVDWRPIVWIVAAPLLTALSALSNESGMAFVGLFVAHALLLRARGWTSHRGVTATGAVAAVLVAVYWQFRVQYIGEAYIQSNQMFRRTDNPQYFIAPGILPWLAMRLVIQVKNTELLFLPTQLCSEYSYNCPPSIESFADARLPQFLIIAAAVLTVIVLCTVLLLRHRDALTLSFSAALVWILVPYIPVSHLFVHAGTFISERCLYTPSIGVVMFIAFLVTSPRQRQWRAVALIATAALVLFWSYITFLRVDDMYDDQTLFRSAIRVCPGSGKSYYQLASALIDKDFAKRADPEVITLLRKAYELDSEVKESLYFLAIYEYATGNAQKALDMFRECASSPYTLAMCYPLFSKLREELHPSMKNWQIFEDNAAIRYLPEEKAAQFRLAGIALARDENDMCRSAQYLRRALDLWNESGLFWAHTRTTKDNSVSYCTTLAHYADCATECLASPDAPQDTETAVIEMANFIRHAMSLCDQEPWANVPFSKRQLYAHRPAQFDRILLTVQESMAQRLLNRTVHDTAARAVRRTIAEAVVRRYCYISTFAQSEVGRQMADGNREIAAVRGAFFRRRQTLLKAAVEASLGMKSQGESEDFFALLKCAPELTAFLK